MADTTIGGLNWSVALRLGRVSNLPTVWVNVLAGAVVTEERLRVAVLIVLVLALSLLYVAGMFLNDFFDREFDRRFRPERPIPAGEVCANTVLAAAVAMIGGAWLLLALVGAIDQGSIGWAPVGVGIALTATIVVYDSWHKGNPFGPLVMGGCRAMVYVVAALAFTDALHMPLFYLCLASICYVAGLTYAAKHENLLTIGSAWPLALLAVPAVISLSFATETPLSAILLVAFVLWVVYALGFHISRVRRNTPRAVVFMIAGISLMDALFISQVGRIELVFLALLGFGLTLCMQRAVSGT